MSKAMPITLRAVLDAALAGMRMLLAKPPMRLSRWAGFFFKLSVESSHASGQWVAFPPQIGVMDSFSNDDIEEVTVRKAKRVGYTKMLVAFIAYNAAHRRRKQAVYQPTDDDRDSFVKTEIDPMIRDCEEVRKVLVPGKEDTIKLKTFLGSLLHLLGAKAARVFRRITVAVVMMDEADAMDQRVEKSIDPMVAAKGRLEGAPFPKFVAGSTVRIAGISHIQQREEQADAVMQFTIECMHCGVDHPLIWGGVKVAHGFKWDGSDPTTVRHVCPHCRKSITQADYLRIWDSGAAWRSKCGRYVLDHHGGVWQDIGPRQPGRDNSVWLDAEFNPVNPPRHVAFVDFWTAYSPQREWVDIVREFLAAKVKADAGETGPLETFVNETLAQYWEIKGERSDEHALQARAEPYKLCTVPKGGLYLTAGVDVQRNRWEITVYAWGRGQESWVVDVVIIEGNPAVDDEWDAVTQQLQRRYVQEWHGGSLGISATSIDSSDQTQAVYNWVSKAQHVIPKLRAIKGDGSDNLAIVGPSNLQEINWRGRKVQRGIKLWRVGTDAAKDLLLGQLSIEHPGPGYIHFSDELPREFYEQLTAEQRILAKVQGRDQYKWVKRRPRNEQLDNRNYAMHAAMCERMHKWTDVEWSRLEAVVQPPADLFSQPGQIEVKTHPSADKSLADSYKNSSESAQPQTPTAEPRQRAQQRAPLQLNRQW